jgi:hypothetical protein
MAKRTGGTLLAVERLRLDPEVQSMAFLRQPGIAALYSGDEIMKASVSVRRRENSCAPLGDPLFAFHVTVVGRTIELRHAGSLHGGSVIAGCLSSKFGQLLVQRVLAQRGAENENLDGLSGHAGLARGTWVESVAALG